MGSEGRSIVRGVHSHSFWYGAFVFKKTFECVRKDVELWNDLREKAILQVVNFRTQNSSSIDTFLPVSIFLTILILSHPFYPEVFRRDPLTSLVYMLLDVRLKQLN